MNEEKVKVPEKDGVYPETSMSEYIAWPILSSGSPGKLRRGTLAEVKESLGDGTLGNGDSGDDGSVAKKLGNVVHSAILEPDDFETRYLSLPAPDPEKHKTGTGAVSKTPASTKAYKDEVAEFAAAHPENVLIEAAQYEKGIAMRDHVFKHPEAKALLQAEGLVEASLVVTDPEFGLRWKLRPDKWIEKVAANLSVKTSRNARPDVFVWDFFKFHYDMKEAIYRMLMPEVGLDVRNSWMLVLETERAHGIALLNLTHFDGVGGVLDLGRDRALHYMRQIADAVERDEWPGIPTGIIDLHPTDKIHDQVAQEIIEP